MGGEELLGGRSLRAGAAGHFLQFLERHRHSPRILADSLEERVAVVVGLALLLPGIPGVQDGVADGAELGVRQGGRRLAGRGDSFQGRARQQGVAHLLLRMLHGDMADFMADHPEQFVVRHHVHDAGVHADAAVGARESVHLVFLVHFEVQRNAVHGRQALGQVAETLRVGVGLRQYLALGIELGNILVDIGLHLLIGQGHGRRGDHTPLEKAARIERFGAGDEHQHAHCEGKKSFHDTANINKSS